MKCRHCSAGMEHTFLDLGIAPPSNAYLTLDDLSRPERVIPLKVMVCHQCWLVQTLDYARRDELFSAEYAYFSSTSSGWLAHAAQYANDIIRKLQLGSASMVVEVASNDGYLLRNFLAAGIPCLGIEPTDSTAAAAERLGIPVIRSFFGEILARELVAAGQSADLIVGNNVYAHVPDINDFTRGLKIALKPGGTITMEFPHVLKLIEDALFDTVYHEHFSYLSLYTVNRIFEAFGLRVWDVEMLPTHGGSLRIFGCHSDDARPGTAALHALLDLEARKGMQDVPLYRDFQAKADRIRDDLLAFLHEQKKAGKQVAAYGAAAKGNTLLNYAGITPELVPFVCDAAASKQGKFMPGSHIPIFPPAELLARRPDYLLILPWNIAAEVRQQNAHLATLGTRFVTAVPRLEIE